MIMNLWHLWGRIRRGGALCGYLGCGEYATRHAVDRQWSPIVACPDPAHGRAVAS